jgi:hypothetical protein
MERIPSENRGCRVPLTYYLLYSVLFSPTVPEEVHEVGFACLLKAKESRLLEPRLTDTKLLV